MSDPDRAPHVLVVDDDDRIRDLLAKFLRAQGMRVSTAPNAEKALAMLRSLAFDLLILDVMMPGMNGFDLTREIRATRDCPILLLTARGEPEDRIKGLSLGADDYLAKPFEPEELLLRAQAILRRMLPRTQGPAAVRFGPWRFEIDAGQLTRGEERVRLTGGEAALLGALAGAAGEPVSRLALSERAGAGSGERAVDVQITRLRRKIEDDPRDPIWIQTVRGEGYRLVAEPEFETVQ
ncbi:DNA-binding response regulator [Marinicauda salina]|uniref:DNA-binding response regulator n=1 Tax=Marinicauda salina TaxID=2135793 RepID=A0A2U2BRS6_9PROT|nr:response regulator transcription factor [Marinicauda salina]PWE16689.1 DNA-binding response regulator [Marinicauda salina]